MRETHKTGYEMSSMNNCAAGIAKITCLPAIDAPQGPGRPRALGYLPADTRWQCQGPLGGPPQARTATASHAGPPVRPASAVRRRWGPPGPSQRLLLWSLWRRPLLAHDHCRSGPSSTTSLGTTAAVGPHMIVDPPSVMAPGASLQLYVAVHMKLFLSYHVEGANTLFACP